MAVTVYSKESCVQCKAVYRWLDKRDIDYAVEMLEENPEQAEKFKALGLMQAPVVVTDDSTFAGFNTNELAKLLA